MGVITQKARISKLPAYNKTTQSASSTKSKKVKKYTFIDLFAGIGGFHFAFHNVGAKCVLASEWNEHARKTYQTNFEKISPDLFTSGNFIGDITKIDKTAMPDFDILTGGFPCQPFSQAGFKKGFSDTRGTLFYDIAEIIEIKKPKAFFLENVRGLLNHDNGKTFETIKKVLTEELGYSLHFNIVKASDHGLPQNRPRLFMIGFRDKEVNFSFPEKRALAYTMSDVFGAPVTRDIGFTLRVGGKGSKITDRRNWDSYMVDGKVKRITPKEGKKMQGFPDDFIFPVSNSEAMKQLGNSVAICAIQDYAKKIIEALDKHYE
ncbi:MAG TPA: DNA cytosine methyltransferase [Candidatus Yonathbacteria bacterium]|nr:DNA cytosine methyltransferase [Candidatus Yonathbacteria bacterium]